jgi:hypothetical protein
MTAPATENLALGRLRHRRRDADVAFVTTELVAEVVDPVEATGRLEDGYRKARESELSSAELAEAQCAQVESAA